MMHKLGQLSVVLLIAGGLKVFYSMASVNDLRWVLAPTCVFVEIVTGETFEFESYAGYMNADYSYLIASSCSGMNFLITAFLMLAIVRLWKREASWAMIPATFLIAYLTTIVANTVRIAVAIRLHRMSPDMIWVNPEQLHRFEGIFIYFGFLLLLFVLSESLNENASSRFKDPFYMLRRSFLPLLIYWAVTLGIPIANGAYMQGKNFWEHSVFVLLTPLILILPLAVYRIMRRHAYDHWRTQ
ncbi:MAG: exosortase K [Pyrinomonadaceae bacterium]